MDRVLTCEAGVSLKPGGANPQGTSVPIESPRMRAKVETDLSAVARYQGPRISIAGDLGLTPQALGLHLLRRLNDY